MPCKILISLFLVSTSLAAQTPFPLQRVDDIGELGLWEDRTEVDLGLAQASWSESEGLLLKGRDDSGRPWTLRLEGFGRVISPVLRGDLDANGRDDLLLPRGFVGNGRCIDRGEIVSLMFDEAGSPIPWRTSTNGIIRDTQTPITVLDGDADGRAEILVTGCEYADPMTEKRWFKGIYEAHDTHWKPFAAPLLEIYQEAATVQLGDWGEPNWKPIESTEWPDLQEGLEAPANLTLDAVIGGEFGCDPHGFYRKDRSADEPPCSEEDSRGGMRFSDGSVRRGVPDIAFESPDKLDIRLDGSIQVRNVLALGSRFRAVGPTEEPDLLWVEGSEDAPRSKLAAQFRVTHVQTLGIHHEDKPVDETKRGLAFSTTLTQPRRVPRDGEPGDSGIATHIVGVLRGVDLPQMHEGIPPPAGRYFSRRGQCFRYHGYDPKDLAWFKPLDNCAELIPESSGLAESDSFRYESLTSQFTMFSSSTRTLTTGPDPYVALRMSNEPSVVVFEEVEGHTGEMVAVVPMGRNGYLAQWRLGSSNWLMTYDLDGKATLPPTDLDFDGELFHADSHRGLVFLVWEEGLPVQAKIVRGHFQWTRARLAPFSAPRPPRATGPPQAPCAPCEKLAQFEVGAACASLR